MFYCYQEEDFPDNSGRMYLRKTDKNVVAYTASYTSEKL
jgi:hypothetical protein